MMGRVHSGPSFRQSLAYCLSDKKRTPGEHPSGQPGSPGQSTTEDHSSDHRSPPAGEVVFKDRAEIIHYNQCYGNQRELAAQFNEVSRLKPNLSKPVMQIMLSLPRGEQLSKAMLVRIGDDCAKAMGFAANQYVTILHKDTKNQHLHMVANRVGFDGVTVSDSYSQGRIADFCRAAERKHGLRQEPGPIRYRGKGQGGQDGPAPRQGIRLDQLKNDIRESLNASADYPAFQRSMEQRGYTVYCGPRGIAFMDAMKVVFKGCDAGYPLKLIGQILARPLEIRIREQQAMAEEQSWIRQMQQQKPKQKKHGRHR